MKTNWCESDSAVSTLLFSHCTTAKIETPIQDSHQSQSWVTPFQTTSFLSYFLKQSEANASELHILLPITLASVLRPAAKNGDSSAAFLLTHLPASCREKQPSSWTKWRHCNPQQLQSQIGLKFHFTELKIIGVITISQHLKFNTVDGEQELHLERRKLCSVESQNAGWSLPFPQRNHSKLHATAVNQSVYNGTRCF